jgi:hypothetical protein
MGNTFLTHSKRGCGGSVVLDASVTAKLVAPSFCINLNGIGSLTLDINIANGGNLNPSFWCTKCGDTVEKNNVGEELTASCQICGYEFPVSDLSVHTHITTICTTCLSTITKFFKGEKCPSRISDYVDMYSLTKNMKVVPLAKVLSSPIKI